MAEFVLTLTCPDRPGIVHAVAAYLHLLGCNILDSQQFDDRLAGQFFMRVHVETVPGADTGYQALHGGFGAIASEFRMEWELHDAAVQPRVLVMVSKAGHCLNDLLYRRAAESLRIEVPLVVGNHPDLASLAAAHGVPFEHVPVEGSDALARQRAEGRLLDLIAELNIDFVVLARYMRILTPELCAKLSGRIINIHHGFLPSFKGARPYHQAYEHGVKLIGATAHYVTADLDEGPIIEQEVLRVDHTHTPEALVALGRDAERIALARAVRWHAEHRVLLHGRRTVIFKLYVDCQSVTFIGAPAHGGIPAGNSSGYGGVAGRRLTPVRAVAGREVGGRRAGPHSAMICLHIDQRLPFVVIAVMGEDPAARWPPGGKPSRRCGKTGGRYQRD